ncbi:hypothetical protein [Streptomyces sp. NPDC057682]|uniref:hypothetical protein n=1 Tax=unclassified Streptomyces TaxID=2593676 RepID=UPI00365CA505
MDTWREGARAGHTHEPNEVTIQLDGIGRQLSELLPEPNTAPEGDGPVFVDESGRRGKTLRRLGWVLAAICVAYAVTLVVAVLGGSSSAPFLPISGQEEHRKAEDVTTPATPGAGQDASSSPDATPGASPSAPQGGQDAAATTGTGAGTATSGPAGGTTTPAGGATATDPTGPSGRQTTGATTGIGGDPGGGTSTTPPAADSTPPDGEPTESTEDPVTPTAENPEPPVQQQEGAS